MPLPEGRGGGGRTLGSHAGLDHVVDERIPGHMLASIGIRILFASVGIRMLFTLISHKMHSCLCSNSGRLRLCFAIWILFCSLSSLAARGGEKPRYRPVHSIIDRARLLLTNIVWINFKQIVAAGKTAAQNSGDTMIG